MPSANCFIMIEELMWRDWVPTVSFYHDRGTDAMWPENSFEFQKYTDKMLANKCHVTECQLFHFIMIEELMPRDRVPTVSFYHDRGTDAMWAENSFKFQKYIDETVAN